MKYTPICCQCGGPRSTSSGKRCFSCYKANVARKKMEGFDGETWRALLELERIGEIDCLPTSKADGLWRARFWNA